MTDDIGDVIYSKSSIDKAVLLFFLLFSGIVELVFIRSTEAFLDSAIDPQSFHGCQQFFGEWLSVLHARDDVHHHLGVGLIVGEQTSHKGKEKGKKNGRWSHLFIHACLLCE